MLRKDGGAEVRLENLIVLRNGARVHVRYSGTEADGGQ